MNNLKNLADKIYNNMEVLKVFSDVKKDNEAIFNILPIVNELERDTDKLNHLVINKFSV